MAVLLLGNGINRAEGLSPGWTGLLQSIARKYCFVPEDSLSNTLGYEMLENRILKRDPKQTITDIHRQIADGVQTDALRSKTDWSGTLHERLLGLPVNTILTTNYDYALERCLDPAFRRVYNTRETTYSLRRYQCADGKTVFHIHGECDYPRSICLGFEHYAGSLQRIREGIVNPTSSLGDGHTYQLADIINGVTPKPEHSWIYDFFLEDLYILGLELDACEIELWWLLSYRARQIALRALPISNRIHYLNVSVPKNQEEASLIIRRERLLESFDVRHVACAGMTFREKYDFACRWLSRRLK